MKTVENAAAVELRCLRIFAQSVNISQVWIKILITVKNVEFVGKEHDQFYCMLVRTIFYQKHVAFFELLRLFAFTWIIFVSFIQVFNLVRTIIWAHS